VEVLTAIHANRRPHAKNHSHRKCMYKAHKKNRRSGELIAVKGCHPSPMELLSALRKAGIEAESSWFEKMDQLPGLFMPRYASRPEFEEYIFGQVIAGRDHRGGDPCHMSIHLSELTFKTRIAFT